MALATVVRTAPELVAAVVAVGQFVVAIAAATPAAVAAAEPVVVGLAASMAAGEQVGSWRVGRLMARRRSSGSSPRRHLVAVGWPEPADGQLGWRSRRHAIERQLVVGRSSRLRIEAGNNRRISQRTVLINRLSSLPLSDRCKCNLTLAFPSLTSQLTVGRVF